MVTIKKESYWNIKCKVFLINNLKKYDIKCCVIIMLLKEVLGTEYTLKNVKYLCDNYDIKKSEDGKHIIVNRSSGQPVFGSDLEPNVKFAHTWFLARQEDRPRTAPIHGITEENIADHLMNKQMNYIIILWPLQFKQMKQGHF